MHFYHSTPNFINKSDPQSALTDQDPVTGASVVFRRRDKADLGVLVAAARLGAAKAERIAKYEGNMNDGDSTELTVKDGDLSTKHWDFTIGHCELSTR